MKIAIVDLGYVGLPLALAFAEKGLDVLGVETDAEKAGQELGWAPRYDIKVTTRAAYDEYLRQLKARCLEERRP